ncbi:GHKL domain-containing protein [Peptostreptococcaceae bacterium AGR-M142]
MILLYTLSANIFAMFHFLILIKYMFDLKIKFTIKESLYLISIGIFRTLLTLFFNRALELSIYYIVFIFFLYKFYPNNKNALENNHNDIDSENQSTYNVLIGFFIVFITGSFSDAFISLFHYYIGESVIIVKNVPNYLTNSFVIFFFMFIFASIFKLLKNKFIFNFDQLENRKTLAFYLVFLCLNIAYIVYKFIIVMNDFKLYFQFLFVFVAYGCFMGAIIVFMMKNVKLERDAKNKMQLYTDIIENSVEEIRSYKHDQKNVLATLKEYIDNTNNTNLKNYFYTQIYNEIPDVNNKEFLQLSKIHSLPLKGLLVSKLTRAKNNNIEVDIMVSGTVNELFMKDVVYCKIFGILFDNAIEEAQKSKDKQISLGFVSDTNNLYYILSNSLASMPDCNKIFEKNISSKGHNRGLGLYTVKKIITKNPNCKINTFIDSNTFYQEITIQKQSNKAKSLVTDFKNKINYNNLEENKIS